MTREGIAALAPSIVPTNIFVNGITKIKTIINGIARNTLIIKSVAAFNILFLYKPSDCVLKSRTPITSPKTTDSIKEVNVINKVSFNAVTNCSTLICSNS
ncbi:hypothetical protein SDC9_184871 [bioreactor metagenome]|uniref:Uncharacterized protein n=1 Tax=bioreactor metagenome TaxID=1076179 RepID=A0A645HML3_9ZZZZ